MFLFHHITDTLSSSNGGLTLGSLSKGAKAGAGAMDFDGSGVSGKTSHVLVTSNGQSFEIGRLVFSFVVRISAA